MGFNRKRRNAEKKAKALAGLVDNMGPFSEVAAPNQDKVILKEVPAKIWRFKGTPQEEFAVVGSAVIYEDGSVDVIYFEDKSEIAEWAVQQLEQMLGERSALTHYSLPEIRKQQEGGSDGVGSA